MTGEPDQQHMIDTLLREQITTLEKNLNRRLDETNDSVNRRFDAQDRALNRIELKVDRTNGRVTALETARERAKGIVFAFKWVPPVMTAAVTAGLTILTLALTGGIH
jgi:hypothetical protein